MTPLERHCGWLLHAYPAWYRHERAGEMLGTLLEASPPGRRWPSFRDARALVTGGLRVRGWTWSLSMVWLAAGAFLTGYAYYAITRPFESAEYNTAGILGFSAGPTAVQISAVLASVAWLTLPLPVLIAGFIRLCGWQRGSRLRGAAWAGAWIAGAALLWLASGWGYFAGVSWRELLICPAWLLLGAVVTRILAAPAPPRARFVPDKTATGE